MNTLFALLGCLGEGAILYAVFILLRLSQKLGEVTKMRPYYKGYYAAAVSIGLSVAIRFVQASFIATAYAGESITAHSMWLGMTLAHHIFLALGLTLTLVIAWKYWGWLYGESFSLGRK